MLQVLLLRSSTPIKQDQLVPILLFVRVLLVPSINSSFFSICSDHTIRHLIHKNQHTSTQLYFFFACLSTSTCSSSCFYASCAGRRNSAYRVDNGCVGGSGWSRRPCSTPQASLLDTYASAHHPNLRYEL